MEMLKQPYQHTAQKEIDCLMDCSMMLDVHMKKGNLTQALALTQDMQNSIVSLQNNIKEQKTRKQLHSIVSKMQSLEVASSIVKKYFDNKKS